MSLFGKLFGKSPSVDTPAQKTQNLPPDAFAGARAASREVLGLAMAALKDDRGIHLESLYCALGAVAGHACQASVVADARAAGKRPEQVFDVASTTDGGRYYFGDALNRPLAEDRVSIWSLVAGAAAHSGAQQIPDINEIFRHNAAVLGSEQFGLPRLPPGHPVHGKPIDYARRLWPAMQPAVARLAEEPRMWPVAVGLAIQELMAQAGGQVPPDMVVRIVMESAIPVSKIPI